MRPFPDIVAFEERAAICEFESAATRAEAENQAARDQGFVDANDYWAWLADYVLEKTVPR